MTMMMMMLSAGRRVSCRTARTWASRSLSTTTSNIHLDERGLVQFDTLHNMVVRSCDTFAEKNLFATYSEASKKFEWMTFQECKLLLVKIWNSTFHSTH